MLKEQMVVDRHLVAEMVVQKVVEVVEVTVLKK
jgi:hypothetical protein